jgi:hypothetical protein
MKTVLIVLLLASNAVAISPQNEVWIHRLRLAPEYPMVYAYRDAKTYIYLCPEETACNFYEFPCGYREQTGLSHAFYAPLYSTMFQATNGQGTVQWGLVQCFFPIKLAIQIQVVGIIPFVWFIDLEKLASASDFPEDQFVDNYWPPVGTQ